MELFSILGQASPVAEETRTPAPAVDVLSFPGDDGGRSLTAMARRDLYVALQLLAERAQYITGASGAAVALKEKDQMICRASAGAAAPELGAHLQVNSGLSAESVRSRKTLRCDNAESDPRVNRESCRTLGIASVVVMPLLKDDEVNGVFELLSERPYAFEERDINALERLGEMIQTAIEHADAAQRVEAGFVEPPSPTEAPSPAVATVPDKENNKKEVVGASPSTGLKEQGPKAQETQLAPASPAPATPASLPAPGPVSVAAAAVNKCASCGFPVSEGRTLCLDCEAREPGGPVLSDLAENDSSWLGSHVYLIATVIIALLTIAVIILRH
jgi:putative methionine-R-sulfoxide reductase with GAF domain